MKKLVYVIAGLVLCCATTQTVSALDMVQTNPGDPVTITTTNGNAFDSFTPSTNVVMDGETDILGFAVGAYHNQVITKKAGKEFGMASDSSAMWFNDIASAGDTATAVGTTNSTVFGGTWQKM